MNITAFDLAQRFVGMKEVAGTASNPAILAMLRLDDAWPENDEVPWCSAFVNYICWLLRLPRSKSLAARSWLNVGHVVDPGNAAAGMDVVILERPPSPTAGHVGLFAGWHATPLVRWADRTPDEVLILGGNQANAVSIATFPVSRVIGIRRLA